DFQNTALLSRQIGTSAVLPGREDKDPVEIWLAQDDVTPTSPPAVGGGNVASVTSIDPLASTGPPPAPPATSVVPPESGRPTESRLSPTGIWPDEQPRRAIAAPNAI